MASKIKVDTLETANGSGTIALSNQLSGMTTASLPSGSVLQVVQASNSTSFVTSSASFVDTPLTATITPTSTSSKILVMWTIQVLLDGTNKGIGTKLLSGSTGVYQSGSSYDVYSGAASNASRKRPSWSYLDSPSTTSAVTYKVQVQAYGGAVTIHDTNSASQIILMEIQG